MGKRNRRHLESDASQQRGPLEALPRSEHGEQVVVVQYCQLKAASDWRYGLLVAIPNAGKRTPATGRKMRLEGLAAGFPDLQLNLASHGYNGLFVEMKSAKGRVAPLQREWHARLTRAGNFVTVRRDADSAIALINWYLAGAEIK